MKISTPLCAVGIMLFVALTGCDSPASTDAHTSLDITDATVDYVVDGDTIRATVDGNSERIRLLGIDTPELGRDGRPDERCAVEAKQFLADWITDSTVTISTDPHSPERDRYDRILAYVDSEGTDVSQTMLEEGWADLYTGNNELTRWSEYIQATKHASKQECPDPQQ